MAIPLRLTVLVALFIAGSVLAGEGPRQPDTTNAALRYWRIWANVTTEDMKLVREVKAEDLTTPEWTPDPALLEAVASFDFGLLIKASRFPECDFGLDTATEGPMALLSHLGPMRATVIALVIDARARLDSGDADGAVERLVVGYRVVEHVSREPVVISGLVAHACFRMVDQMVAYAIDKDALTPEHRQALRGALAAFDPADPFTMRADLDGERRHLVGWLTRLVEIANDADFEAELVSLELDDNLNGLMRWCRTNRDVAKRQILLVDDYYQSMLRVWDETDAPEEINALLDKAGKLQFGAFTGIFTPALNVFHRKYRESREAIAAARERLEP